MMGNGIMHHLADSILVILHHGIGKERAAGQLSHGHIRILASTLSTVNIKGIREVVIVYNISVLVLQTPCYLSHGRIDLLLTALWS